jgi:hypothetical protein
MNGWMRLWVLVSVLWLSLVGVIVYVSVVSESYDPPYTQDIYNSLSTKAKPFYFMLNENAGRFLKKGDEDQWLLTDEVNEALRPFYKEYSGHPATLFSIQSKLKGANGYSLSVDEIKKRLIELKEQDALAPQAKEEFDRKVEEAYRKKAEARKKAIIHATTITVVPSVLLLLVGYGVAWVRRGFQASSGSNVENR